ncbi:MAG: DUF4149 domain-containing protein [Acidobacteria bacterium]|nr:DUF4149 domain-containing protein [Acidobacteriota bacterium]
MSTKQAFFSGLIETIHAVVLATWFGGITVFSFLVAPAAFQVLPTTQLAGDLVANVLAKLYLLGTLCGVFLLLTSNSLRSRGLMGIRRSIFLITCLLIALASNIYAQWGIAPRVAELRNALNSMPAPEAGDPRKLEFDRMHQRSVQLMTVNLLALLVAVALSRRSSAGELPSSPPSATTPSEPPA